MFLKFVHVACIISTSFFIIAAHYSIVWICLSIYLLMDILGCFQFGPVMNKVVTGIRVGILFRHTFSIFLG
jgi:hypothetical protein